MCICVQCVCVVRGEYEQIVCKICTHEWCIGTYEWMHVCVCVCMCVASSLNNH